MLFWIEPEGPLGGGGQRAGRPRDGELGHHLLGDPLLGCLALGLVGDVPIDLVSWDRASCGDPLVELGRVVLDQRPLDLARARRAGEAARAAGRSTGRCASLASSRPRATVSSSLGGCAGLRSRRSPFSVEPASTMMMSMSPSSLRLPATTISNTDSSISSIGREGDPLARRERQPHRTDRARGTGWR